MLEDRSSLDTGIPRTAGVCCRQSSTEEGPWKTGVCRAVQLLICVKNDVCVYVIEKCELILGGACATYSHKGELCFIICGYLCIVMLHAVEREISALLIDGILDSVTAGSVFPAGQAFAGGHGPWRIGLHGKMQ